MEEVVKARHMPLNEVQMALEYTQQLSDSCWDYLEPSVGSSTSATSTMASATAASDR